MMKQARLKSEDNISGLIIPLIMDNISGLIINSINNNGTFRILSFLIFSFVNGCRVLYIFQGFQNNFCRKGII